MQRKLHNIAQKVKSALLSYPMVLAMAIIMASTIVYMIETDWKVRESFLPIRIIFTSSLGISLMFAVKMFSQRASRDLLWHILGLLILAVYFLVLPSDEDKFTEMYAFIIIPTYILSHLLVACIPFLGKEPEIRFWQYNKNLFINFFLTVIFTGVLTGGVELAFLAIDQLFGMEFKGEIYAETFTVLAIAGSAFIFLLFNEKGLGYLEQEGSYPVVLKFFTQFILIPLLLIYVVILYFYSAKILFKWELPEGWVSYLVLAYSIVGILALLLVHPLKGDSAKSWVKIFSKVFYYSLLPLIVLLFTAIFTRVLEYGFTEPRYYVVLLAVWLLAVVLYFIFAKLPNIKFIPVSLFILGLFSLIFPYFSALSVSTRSQKNELEMVLNTHKLLENGKINFKAPLPYDVAQEVSDKFNYLSQRFEFDYLRTLLDEKSKKSLSDQTSWYISDLFVNKTSDTDMDQRATTRIGNSKPYVAVSDYQFVIEEHHLSRGAKLNGDSLALTNKTFSRNPVYLLKLNSKEQLDLMPLVKVHFSKYSAGNSVETDSLFVEGDLGKYHVKVVFDYITRNMYEKEVSYEFSEAMFLIRER